jgi:asparagine synthase (glutamine-hydrolysing)
MCGIAGIIDLSGERRPVPPGAIQAMASAIVHRGPDEDGFLELPGLAFANRRLSIVGLHDGKQPIHNEDRSVSVVFNGELFDYPEMKAELEAKGHRFATHCDTEIIPHRWEDHEEAMWEQLRGQFAVALYDRRKQRVVIGRDRFGICPLYWTRQTTDDGEWLLFASEVKALLASGMVEARPEPRGLNQLFTFFGLPGPYTCFKGVYLLPPGHYLRVQFRDSACADVAERTYWQMQFPDWGKEERGKPLATVVAEFESLLIDAVERRLRADVPVVSYLSGGVDSSVVVAMASKVRGSPIPCFTIRIKAPKLDETTEAGIVAQYIGADPIVVDCGPDEVLNTYPELIRAAEGPVVDTSCAALLLLAREVHNRGFKVAQTGEGSDEWLAGYPWHKVNRVLGWLDVIPKLPLSQLARRLFTRLSGSPRLGPEWIRRSAAATAGYNGWHDIYSLMSMSRLRFFSDEMKRELADHVPYEDLAIPPDAKRWHPLNRELYMSARCHLAGLLLNAKGDRVAMNSSVETRYPFLDEAVFAYLAKMDPRMKLRGLHDKYILRHVAARWLPREIAFRRKAMFRAPFDSFHLDQAPPFVHQLLGEESLRKTGYFDVAAVTYWRKAFRDLWARGAQRVSVEMGLVGVLASQLWHHTYIDGSLCELPSLSVVSGQSSIAKTAVESAAPELQLTTDN